MHTLPLRDPHKSELINMSFYLIFPKGRADLFVHLNLNMCSSLVVKRIKNMRRKINIVLLIKKNCHSLTFAHLYLLPLNDIAGE